ncbi:lysophospholipase [Tissierella carlieri]|uniref:Lysophospholipase n=1 Tax=Tissierella carlieri TaxID=689904 RepID=A0ABT1S9S6_9FIRM|nr:alpha/beta fold hydrolase [Tissierella carlieri]MCQ4923229.1 lysophospholipase [Tissierella carlieri]
MNKTNRITLFLMIILILTSVIGCTKNNDNDEIGTEFIEEEYNLEVAEGNIYGTLTLPKEGNNFPVAIIIAGSGPTDRDGNNPLAGKNNSLKMISESLAKEGIASIRYDKRGIGESKSLVKKEEDLIFEDYIDDVVRWVNKLREDKRFSKVIIIGHSEGALIGATASYKSNVEGFISVSGMGYSAYDTLKRQLKNQSGDIYDKSLPLLDTLKEGNLIFNPPQELYSLFRPSVQPYMISWFKYDPVAEIANVKVPILILQGDNDIQVEVTDAEILHEGNPDSKLVIIKGMNHVLKDAPTDKEGNMATYSKPDLPLNQEFITEIITFVKGI